LVLASIEVSDGEYRHLFLYKKAPAGPMFL